MVKYANINGCNTAGLQVCEQKLNKGFHVKYMCMQQTVVFMHVHLFVMCVRLSQCDKTLSQRNWERSVLAVGCWFGQAAIPLCHWGHSGVQLVDGSHTLSHTHITTQRHTQTETTRTHTKSPHKQQANTRIDRQNHTAAACTGKHTGTWANKPCVHTWTHTHRRTHTHTQTQLLCSGAFTIPTDLRGSAAGLV